jgi:hypothetical protein
LEIDGDEILFAVVLVCKADTTEGLITTRSSLTCTEEKLHIFYTNHIQNYASISELYELHINLRILEDRSIASHLDCIKPTVRIHHAAILQRRGETFLVSFRCDSTSSNDG